MPSIIATSFEARALGVTSKGVPVGDWRVIVKRANAAQAAEVAA